MDVKHLPAFQGFSAEKLQKHNVFKPGASSWTCTA